MPTHHRKPTTAQNAMAPSPPRFLVEERIGEVRQNVRIPSQFRAFTNGTLVLGHLQNGAEVALIKTTGFNSRRFPDSWVVCPFTASPPEPFVQ